MEDYQCSLKQHLDECDVRKATLEMLLMKKDGTTLMRSKVDFEDRVCQVNQALQGMQMPTSSYPQIEGLDQLPKLISGINECLRCVRYTNPELEERIHSSYSKDVLNLRNIKLTSFDVAIIADVLRRSEVSYSNASSSLTA